eukprot:TRINITY_DN120985_c0_g1_i1.p1 TRINITY_DN120985_c0_g1~~TRINITY_DN120985_c0_g1_i1.p1  ORF type:complete len:675 (-),score=112.18 TRINITY_DN120985_c0_g1_i1:10-2034(-)
MRLREFRFLLWTPGRLLHLLGVCLLVANTGAGEDGSVAATVQRRAGASERDSFSESLHLRRIPFSKLASARFEFVVSAPMDQAFRAGHFDLFPKSVGKLLNTRPYLSGFEATLTRGRWKEEWGAPPREYRPSGATLVMATTTAESNETSEVWRFLISALSGSLCASFEGMDPQHEGSSPWVKPMEVPWVGDQQQLRYATLPYEPVCTENLTPWLKLLPCGHRRGLTALLAPLSVAESPLTSLSLTVVMQEGKAVLRAALDVVLDVKAEATGFAAWFGQNEFKACSAAESSVVFVHSDVAPDQDAFPASGMAASSLGAVEGVSLAVSSADFVGLKRSAQLSIPDVKNQSPPWSEVRSSAGRSGSGALSSAASVGLASSSAAAGLAVMRDILSQEGFSERTHGRYLLKFSNPTGTVRRVRFMDQLPFFIRPMWQSFRVSIRRPDGETIDLHGWEAMRRFSVKFVPTDGFRQPTELQLEATVAPEETISIFLDVLKNFIQLREFSYACEKGFDVGSAAWIEIEGTEDADPVQSFRAALAPTKPSGSSFESTSAEARTWKLRFTQGYIVLLPMPDFSMPFNVIALSSTAVTFFFGSVFRLSAAGKVPHWVMKRDKFPSEIRAEKMRKALIMALLAGFIGLGFVESTQLVSLRGSLGDAGFVVDYLETAKAFADQLVGR